MEVLQRLEEASNVFCGILFRHFPLFTHSLKKIAAGKHVRHEVYLFLVFIDSVHTYYEPVVNSAKRLNFVF
jgi:hypothetical protein